ncbi:gas vesicle protein GvpG [Streptomyces sp. NPDC093225]|uniref:gas vesicle protein GvpG n=1 Tax=Streptomyces sp. NPDC093225 TaxID=3366034 RepID=UPI00381F1283
MGLLTGLLGAPLAPVRAVVWVAQQVAEQAEREFYDPAPVWAALADLDRQLRSGEIDDAEFERREGELLDRLDEIARFRQEPGEPGAFEEARESTEAPEAAELEEAGEPEETEEAAEPEEAGEHD